MVRKSWLEKGHRAGGEGRESDQFVRVSWEKAAKLVAGELKRVRETYDPGAIWGGSYGWIRTTTPRAAPKWCCPTSSAPTASTNR